MLEEVASLVPRHKAPVKAAVEEGSHKVELYMGHKIRALVQERRKQEIHEEMCAREPGEE